MKVRGWSKAQQLFFANLERKKTVAGNSGDI